MFEFLKNKEAEQQLLCYIISELELEEDVLNNALADIKLILSKLMSQPDKKTQEIISKIFGAIPRLVQPAILLNDGILLFEQQSKQGAILPVAESESSRRATQINNNEQVNISNPPLSSSPSRTLVSRFSNAKRANSRGSKILVKKPESLIEEILYLLQEINTQLLGKQLSLLAPSLQKIIDVYENFLNKWRTVAISQDERDRLIEVKVEVQFKTTKDNFYLMRQELARKILCRDEYGFLRKSNNHGNHAVSISPQIVKKGSLTEGELDPILPGMEKIVVSFCNMLGEKLVAEDLTAPTTLIKLNHLVFQKIQEKDSDPSQWQNFNELYKSGQYTADDLIKQFSGLVIEPKEVDAFIQVGKTLHGWSLHDLLNLLQKFDQLQRMLGNEMFLQTLPGFISGSYVDFFIQNNNKYAHWLNNYERNIPNYSLVIETVLSEQFNYLFNIAKLQEPHQRLKEFSSINFNELNERKINDLMIEFKKIVEKYSPEQKVSAFAFLTYWPGLVAGYHFDELVQITKLLKKIPELIPNASVPEIINELPRLTQLFDVNNFTALVMSSLLINPCDGKADNYMAEFIRNDAARITKIKIKGIDNDQALAHPIVRSETIVKTDNPETGKVDYKKVEVHYAGVKCVLFTLSSMMMQKVSQEVIKQFKAMNPEIFLLSWLVEQYQDENGYQKLLTNIPSEFTIDIPLRLDPRVVPLMLSKLRKMHQIFQTYETMTHQQLFYLMEPILSMFYTKVLEEQRYPLATMSRIYHGGSSDCPTIEGVLQQTLDNYSVTINNSQSSLRELLQTYKEGERYYKYRNQSIEDVVNDFIFKYLNLSQIATDQNLLWPILRLCANFSFLKKLPLSQEMLHNLLFEAITKNESSVVNLLIHIESVDVNTTRVIQGKLYTPLRFAVIQPKPVITIIDALLKHKKIKPDSFDYEGDTALSLTDPKNFELINILIQNGIDIDTSHTKTGKTLIELAIDNKKFDVFYNLVQQGAGKKLNAQYAFNFISSCYQFSENIDLIQQASTILATQNSSFAWLLTLNSITQLDNPENNLYPVDVVIEQRIERRFIKNSVMSKIFAIENGVVKGIKKDNLYGRRAVAFVDHEGQKMHVKSHPEIFATEEGVRLLWRLVFLQGGIAETGVLRFFDQVGNPYPVLISRHIEGENLQKVVQDLEQVRTMNNELDEQRFSEVLVMTMLTNPEDDKPDNKILRYFINYAGVRKLEIVGIDNDHAFVFPIVREKGHRVLQVKTITACIEQMREPLHPSVKKIILSLQPGELLRTWLEMLAKRQELYDELFSEEDRRRFFNDPEQPILTRMPLPIGMIAHMYSTLTNMQKILKANPEISQVDFLVKVEPSFVAYKHILETIDNPGARFHQLFQERYSTLVANRFDTLVTGKHILQSAKIPDKAMISSSVDYGPLQALKELKDALNEDQILNSVKQELLQGQIIGFKKLLLSSSHQTILKDIVFKDLTPDIRNKILRSLQDLSLDYLDVHGCVDVDVNLLRPIFENSPNILAIDISGCTKLKNDILEIIAKNCEALEKLNLHELPWDMISLKDKPIDFPSLQKLSIRKCSNLKKIFLKVPRLEKLLIQDAHVLTEIDIQGQALTSLALDNCLSIPDASIHRLLGQSPELLKSLNFSGLSSVSARLLIFLNTAYGKQQWQAKNTEMMIKNGLFVLQGTKVNDLDIQKIAYFARRIEHINLVGTPFVTWDGYATLLSRLLTLQSIEKNDYNAPIRKPQKLLDKTIVEAFAAGFGDEYFSVGRDKLLRKHNLTTEEFSFVTAHNVPISSVLAVNDIVFTGATNGILKIWHAATLNLIREIKAHAANIKAIVYIAERNLLISASEDKSIKYWDIYTGLSTKTITTRTKINGFEVMDDKLIVASENGAVSIFNLLSSELISTINAHQNPIFNIKKVSKELFVTISGDYTAKIWDLNTGRCWTTLIGHTSSVTSVEVLQGGHLIATGSLDKTIKIWDVMTGECVNTLTTHARKVNALALINNYLLSASEDETVYSWEFSVKHIAMDPARLAKPFKLLRQDALLRVQCLTKDKFILFGFITDFVTQVVGNSGIGITQLTDAGELLFAINNKNKYFAVDNLLVSLNEFIHHCTFYNLPPAAEKRSSLGQVSSSSNSVYRDRAWTSAVPNTYRQQPKMFALQTRLTTQSVSTSSFYNNFTASLDTSDSSSTQSPTFVLTK